MNLYQAGYYRKGKQGSHSGWGVVSPSEGMGRMAIDGYSGIASNLVELNKNIDMPQVNRGIFKHDLFVYLLQINYKATGLDSRGVSYVHSYCINNTEYYEMMKNPEMLLGIKSEEFPMEYDDSVSKFPVKESLEYESFDFTALLQKYGIGDAEYRQLVLGAICAMEGYSNSMCIKYTTAPEEYDRVSREITYLIMMGIPEHLRMKMTFFSYKGANATIYFSDKVQGNNYVDLDTKEFSCDIARLNTLEFTRIYNSVPAADYRKRAVLLKAIDSFIDEVMENPLRDVGVAQIEAGFQGKIKKNEEGIDPEKAYSLLADFMKMKLKEAPEVYEYIATLLQLINDNVIEIKDDKLCKELRKRFSNTDSLFYKKQVCILTMRKLIAGEEEAGYKLLNELRTSAPEQFEMLCSILEENQGEYYRKYYLTSFLPVTLNDFKKIQAFINQNPGMEDDERFTLFKIIRNVAVRRIKANESFAENHRDSTLAFSLIKTIGADPKFKEDAKVVVREIFSTVWDCYHFSEFDPDDEKLYIECHMEKLSESIGEKKGNLNAIRVLMLCSLFRDEVTKDTVKTLRTVLFTNDVLESISDKERLQDSLKEREIYDSHVGELSGFDAFLMLFYRVKDDTFDVKKWVRKLSDIVGYEDFDPRFVSNVVNNSVLLRKDDIRQKFADSLEAAIKNEKNSSDGRMTRDEIRGCQKYLDGLCGREIKDDYQMDEEANYLNVLHRAFVGFFALVSIGTGLYSLKSYVGETQSSVWVWVALGITIAMMIVGLVCKFFFSDGLEGIIADSGMSESMVKLVIYIGIIIALLVMAGLFYFLARTSFMAKMIGLIIYMVLAVAAAIIYSLLAEE